MDAEKMQVAYSLWIKRRKFILNVFFTRALQLVDFILFAKFLLFRK
ncbi:hypothetical protein DB42_AC00660 [Neochlamydia sp. EPS4]|nr:hypothetical protein DB42_AC00660 [Neochlamydia sp. EPS4]